MAKTDKVIKETKSKKITYVGSSKGGYAALLFGLQKENSNIILPLLEKLGYVKSVESEEPKRKNRLFDFFK